MSFLSPHSSPFTGHHPRTVQRKSEVWLACQVFLESLPQKLHGFFGVINCWFTFGILIRTHHTVYRWNYGEAGFSWRVFLALASLTSPSLFCGQTFDGWQLMCLYTGSDRIVGSEEIVYILFLCIFPLGHRSGTQWYCKVIVVIMVNNIYIFPRNHSLPSSLTVIT